LNLTKGIHPVERERWLQINQIVSACLETEPDRRESFARQRCAGDSGLLAEVESLLDSHANLGDFLANSVWEEPREEILPGSRIGPYEIRDAIAEGGMGTVYRAVRAADFEKQVALKVVKRGMDTSFILESFRHERQILAAFDHANVARLLDGGATADGRPYLVMEYVDGHPITEYCEKRALTIPERLKLFRTICSAVQYAHSNLVVHRDLKPGNILVTTAGEPKLLDFGIARLLEPDACATIPSMRFMTPECASPEQVRGAPITTAADIYALGVLLYQLLAGEPPYRFVTRSPEEVRRLVCETELRKPSTWRPVSADLDNIVFKAMHRDPSRRYASAGQLSEDIERYLTNRPVSARVDTLRYRASKLLARHKATSVAASLLILSLLGGLAATVWEAHVSFVERRVAEQRFRDVRALATSNLFELNDALEKLPASAAARHLLIQRAVEYLDKLRGESRDDLQLMHEVALGYERIAGLQGRFTGAGVGNAEASLNSYRKALAIRSAIAERSHEDLGENQAELNLLRSFIASLLLFGRTEEALRNAQMRLDLSHRLVESHPQDPRALVAEADADLTLAMVLGGLGGSSNTREFSRAINLDRAAIAILTQWNPPSEQLHQMILVARSFEALHDLKSADFQEALRTFDDLLSPQTVRSLRPEMALRLYNGRGNTFARLGDHRKALRDYRQGLALAAAVAARNLDDLDARLEVRMLNGFVAIEEARLGNPQKGLADLNQTAQSVEQMFESRPEGFYRRVFVTGYAWRAEVLSSLGDQPGARTNLARSLALAGKLAQDDPGDLESRLEVAIAHAGLGVLWARSFRVADARNELSISLLLAKQLLASRPDDRKALELARTVESDLSALGHCADGRPCRLVKQFQLPSIVD
jgi:non-specific serine/threonine protein kinase/serine/threonine-protein kinase